MVFPVLFLSLAAFRLRRYLKTHSGARAGSFRLLSVLLVGMIVYVLLENVLHQQLYRQTGHSFVEWTADLLLMSFLMVFIAFFDEKKEPVLRRGGYHKMVSAYDENGLNTKITFFGLNGERVNRSDNGAHYYLFEYDEKMNRSGIKRFDKNGKEL